MVLSASEKSFQRFLTLDQVRFDEVLAFNQNTLNPPTALVVTKTVDRLKVFHIGVFLQR